MGGVSPNWKYKIARWEGNTSAVAFSKNAKIPAQTLLLEI